MHPTEKHTHTHTTSKVGVHFIQGQQKRWVRLVWVLLYTGNYGSKGECNAPLLVLKVFESLVDDVVHEVIVSRMVRQLQAQKQGRLSAPRPPAPRHVIGSSLPVGGGVPSPVRPNPHWTRRRKYKKMEPAVVNGRVHTRRKKHPHKFAWMKTVLPSHDQLMSLPAYEGVPAWWVRGAIPKNRDMKKIMKFSFFHQRHALSTSFDIFVNYGVTNFLPKLVDKLLFSAEKKLNFHFC